MVIDIESLLLFVRFRARIYENWEEVDRDVGNDKMLRLLKNNDLNCYSRHYTYKIFHLVEVKCIINIGTCYMNGKGYMAEDTNDHDDTV